jgi:hypothetical protein
MSRWLPWNRATLTEQDQLVLAVIEPAVAGVRSPNGTAQSLNSFAAILEDTAPRPTAAFADHLEERLMATACGLPERGASIGRKVRRALLVASGAGALAVGTALAMPALGVSTPNLLDNRPKRVAPQVVATPSWVGMPSVAIPPPPAHWTDPSELSRELGLTLYVPDYLPSGCSALGNSGSLPPSPHAAHLHYSCVGITVWPLSVGIRPQVPPGSAEELVVAGHPATLIEGAWSIDSGGEAVWQKGIVQLLIEQPDVTVRVATTVGVLSREELMRIAESLRPVPVR